MSHVDIQASYYNQVRLSLRRESDKQSAVRGAIVRSDQKDTDGHPDEVKGGDPEGSREEVGSLKRVL